MSNTENVYGRTRIKCCGLRRSEDIDMVNAANADFAGFIMSKPFWRYVEPEKVKELKNRLKPGIMAVGVFVNEPLEYVAEQLNNGTIDIAQLHGSENDEYIDALKRLTGRDIENAADENENGAGAGKMPKRGSIIKAFKITAAEDLEKAVGSKADYILLDSGTGTGKTFDWTLMKDAERPYFFAGGLAPENVADAVRRFHPYAVDVSSGIETDKVKDGAKITAFAVNVRAADIDRKG